MFSSSENNMCTCNNFNNSRCAAGSNAVIAEHPVCSSVMCLDQFRSSRGLTLNHMTIRTYQIKYRFSYKYSILELQWDHRVLAPAGSNWFYTCNEQQPSQLLVY
jgi:hypothetical protein